MSRSENANLATGEESEVLGCPMSSQEAGDGGPQEQKDWASPGVDAEADGLLKWFPALVPHFSRFQGRSTVKRQSESLGLNSCELVVNPPCGFKTSLYVVK